MQGGSFDLQMTEKKEPSEATINIKVIHCFNFLPTLLFFIFSARPFSGKALKNSQSSSKFDIFCGSWHNSGNHSIQTCIVVVETSSVSPDNLFSLTPYVFFQLSNHPYEAAKPAKSTLSSLLLISIASSWRRDPSGCTFALVHFQCQLYKISMITLHGDTFYSYFWKTRSPFVSS